MSAVVNDRDALLQGAPSRVSTIDLVSNVRVAPTTITTDRMVPEAATAASTAFIAGGAAALTSTATNIFSDEPSLPALALISTGEPVKILAVCRIILTRAVNSSTHNVRFRAQLVLDGSTAGLLYEMTIPFHCDGIGASWTSSVTIPLTHRWQPASGIHTYAVRASINDITDNATGAVQTFGATATWSVGVSLIAEENKV